MSKLGKRIKSFGDLTFAMTPIVKEKERNIASHLLKRGRGSGFFELKDWILSRSFKRGEGFLSGFIEFKRLGVPNLAMSLINKEYTITQGIQLAQGNFGKWYLALHFWYLGLPLSFYSN